MVRRICEGVGWTVSLGVALRGRRAARNGTGLRKSKTDRGASREDGDGKEGTTPGNVTGGRGGRGSGRFVLDRKSPVLRGGLSEGLLTGRRERGRVREVKTRGLPGTIQVGVLMSPSTVPTVTLVGGRMKVPTEPSVSLPRTLWSLVRVGVEPGTGRFPVTGSDKERDPEPLPERTLQGEVLSIIHRISNL